MRNFADKNDSFVSTKMEATTELTKLEAMKVLLGNNHLACEIKIHGLKMGTCVNEWVIPIIDKQIAEIHKFLNGEPNEWE